MSNSANVLALGIIAGRRAVFKETCALTRMKLLVLPSARVEEDGKIR
jgi:hypothetical protein